MEEFDKLQQKLSEDLADWQMVLIPGIGLCMTPGFPFSLKIENGKVVHIEKGKN